MHARSLEKIKSYPSLQFLSESSESCQSIWQDAKFTKSQMRRGGCCASLVVYVRVCVSLTLCSCVNVCKCICVCVCMYVRCMYVRVSVEGIFALRCRYTK